MSSILSPARSAAEAGIAAVKDSVTPANVRAGLGVAGKAVGWVVNNPATAGCVVVAGAGTAFLAAPGTFAMAGLGAAGFVPSIAAGSTAAGIQATLGNVVAGSAFATLQSAAAGGAGLILVSTAVQAVGGAMLGVGGGVAAWFSQR